MTIPGFRPGDFDRRDFFRGTFGDWIEKVVREAEERVVVQRYYRPPGARSEIEFLASCTRCGECISACPVHAIIKVRPDGGLAAGTPHIDPRLSPCVACPDMPCVAACPTDALTRPAGGWDDVRMGVLELVPERCVTFNGTPCGLCAKACPIGEKALTVDGDGRPVLRAEGCVGCGVCVRACITAPSSLVLSHPER